MHARVPLGAARDGSWNRVAARSSRVRLAGMQILDTDDGNVVRERCDYILVVDWLSRSAGTSERLEGTPAECASNDSDQGS